MHRLLKRQLKKVGAESLGELNADQQAQFINLVDQAYHDADNDRALIENSLEVSSMEMQRLYEETKLNAERKINRTEAKYNRLVHNLKHYYFFYSHDLNGVFTYVSDSIIEMLGYSKTEFLTHYKNYLSDHKINDKIAEYKKLAAKGKDQEPYVINIYHKDKSVKYLELMELPVFDSKGKVIEIEGIARDITDQVEVREQLDHLARHDALTGVPNRYNLINQLEHIIASSKRTEKQFALLFIDLDHFKNINDTLGHDTGDKLLQAVVNKIKPTIRVDDVFARIGGDEFIIVLTEINKRDLVNIINKIRVALREEWVIDDYEIVISSSIGIAMFPEDGSDAQTLMKNADIAMYKAKKMGRDTFSMFTDALNEEVQNEMSLERDMAKALEQDEFVLYYQPKLNLRDDKIIGAEALIRWQHPDRGLVGPYHFIQLAENTGFILKLGRWIVEEACRAIVRFNAASEQKLHVSINISTRQIENDNIYSIIKNAIEQNQIDPQQLHIEITESIMMENSRNTIRILNKIKSLGVVICMDDFGTGYSSLSYLHTFPIDSLKIDKSFVDQITENKSEAVLIDTIIAMGQTLKMEVIAEGVEQAFQKQYLLEKNCPQYQGYLFSKPIPEYEYIQMLKAYDGSHASAK